ncbi:hypothetical protein [Demequina sediminicola]|uniref:hypothetical protein n=1 Tax=Demequina sediminicola TaxID=1095026 RepID=UPI00078221CD|nr:hypothetical protein [Demequina sediminicola]
MCGRIAVDETGMAMTRGDDETPEVLDQVARGLGEAREFEPDVAEQPAGLPGRRGDREASPGAAPIDDAGVLDCGTSRRGGFTHVLWLDRGATPEGLAHSLELSPLVARVEWEGTELLHVEAPGASHGDLLAEARRLARS